MVKVVSMDAPTRITSRDNQHLKFARRVRDGQEKGYLFIEGRRLCDEAVRSNLQIESVLCTDELLESVRSYPASAVGSSKFYVLPEQLLRSIADTANPQGIVILARRPESPDIESLFSQDVSRHTIPIWVFLERINNPSNLGAVMRTAEAAGVKGVIVSTGSADAYSPRSVRASMGSAFRLQIVQGADLQSTSKSASENGIRVFAIDSKGAELHTDIDWKQPSLLVLGSEAEGLADDAIEAIGRSIRISIEPQVESLNIAVACGIILFEARRQNQLSDG